ncbi:MAG: hypothetical protein ACKOXB_02150 [Flavobacteriales bacterium]
MKTAENELIKYWIEDGILHNKIKEPMVMDLDNIKKVIALRHEISAGEKQYWCFNFDGIKSYTKEGRDYADLHGQDYLYGTAAIVNSHITMYLVNIFIKIKNPTIPFRAFKNTADGVAWLNDLRNKNRN